jgi:hypothetical protein
MQITLEVPDEIAEGLATNDLPRVLLEAFALEGYRSGTLGEEQVRRLLGFRTRIQVDDFLKRHEAYLDCTVADVERDAETSVEFSKK